SRLFSKSALIPLSLDWLLSLNRPGGNMTGIAGLQGELVAKRIELLHEMAPKAAITALLGNPKNRYSETETQEFQHGAKLGWREGGNLRIELRWGAGDANRIETLAKELVDLRPDAIFAVSTPVISAVARETHTIPIVFALLADPVGSGLAASLSR